MVKLFAATLQAFMHKENIHQHCVAVLTTRMNAAFAAMEQAQQAANNEEKSSSGDKYETGRAMSQLDRDMYARQAETARQELLVLKKLNPLTIAVEVQNGALFTANGVVYYVAAAIGKIATEHGEVMAISPASPLANAAKGRKKGEHFVFNGKTWNIESVE